jgi:hypothetical protein
VLRFGLCHIAVQAVGVSASIFYPTVIPPELAFAVARMLLFHVHVSFN